MFLVRIGGRKWNEQDLLGGVVGCGVGVVRTGGTEREEDMNAF